MPLPMDGGRRRGGVLLLSSDPLLPSPPSLLSQLPRGFSASYEGIAAPRVFVLMQTDTETTAMAAVGGNSSVRAPWNISRDDRGCLLATVTGTGGAGAVRGQSGQADSIDPGPAAPAGRQRSGERWVSLNAIKRGRALMRAGLSLHRS